MSEHYFADADQPQFWGPQAGGVYVATVGQPGAEFKQVGETADGFPLWAH